MKSFKILAFVIFVVTTTYCHGQVIIISGLDPLGPNSLEEALNELHNGFFLSRFEELKPASKTEFINRHEFEVSRYIRRKWGVLGGQNLYREIAQDSTFSPKLLTYYVLDAYLRAFHKDITDIHEKESISESPSKSLRNGKTYNMQFKVRDGIKIPNCKFEIAQIDVSNDLRSSIGTLYPTGRKVGDLVIKKPLEEHLKEWLSVFSKQSHIEVKINIQDFYAEIAARTLGTEMAVYLNVDISTSNIKRNYSYLEFFKPNMVYTGANVNKAFEKLLEKTLTKFNNEL